MTLTQSEIPGLTLLHRGKVRETYAVGDDRLLLVATDRLSAFDRGVFGRQEYRILGI